MVVRLEGVCFHTFTRGFKKPFDDILVKTMQDTMKYLCENIQGCVLGYTQSDEISLVLTDYAELTTDAWFGNNLQKMCSVSASMTTLAFNKFFSGRVQEFMSDCCDDLDGYIFRKREMTMIMQLRCISINLMLQCLILVFLLFQKKRFVIT